MATRSIGTLTVDMVAKMGGFDEGMSKVDKRMKRTADTIDKHTKRASKALAAMGIVALGASAALIKTQANEAQGYLQTARALNIKIEALSAGTYAAQQFGIQGDKYADTLKDVSDKVGDFLATGAGPMADFFENIAPLVGVTAENFRSLAADDALQLYVTSLEKANVSQNEMTFYLEAIASDASLLIPLFSDGGKEMARFTDEARVMGRVVSQETAEGAEKLNRSLGLMSSAVRGMGNDLLVELNPQIKEFTKLMSDPETIEGIKTLVGGVADLASGMVELFATTSSVTKFIAEEIAADLGGAAIDDLVRLEEKAAEISEVLNASVFENLTSPSYLERFRFFGPNGAFEYWDDDELHAELDNINAAIKAGYAGGEAVADTVADIGKGAKDSAPGVIKLTKELKKSHSVLQDIYDMQNNDFGFAAGTDIFSEDFGDRANEMAVSVNDVGTAYEGLGNISSGVVANLITDWDNASANIGDTFKQMLAGMVSDAATNKIVMQFEANATESATGSSLSSTATSSWWGAIIAAIVVVGNVRNKNEDEKWEKFNAEYRQGTQSTGTLLGSLDEKSHSLNNLIEDLNADSIDVLDVNYAMLSTLVDIRTGLGGIADGFAKTGFGAAGSAAFANIDLGTRAVSEGRRNNINENSIEAARTNFSGIWASEFSDSSFLQGYIDDIDGTFLGIANRVSREVYRVSQEIQDSGIEIFGASLVSIVDGGLLQAQAYTDIKEEKKIFGISTGSNLNTITEGLDEVVLNQLTGVFSDAGLALSLASEQFGIDFGAVVGQLFIEGGRLSLKDLEGDELTAEIESFFSATVDGWAETLLSNTGVLNNFQKVGEGAFETMIRLAAETANFVDAAERLNLNFAASGLDAINQTQGLVSAAGGSDSFNALLGSYSNTFVTDAERFDNVEVSLTEMFASLGFELPKTEAAFVALVEGQEVATAAGQELLISLLQLGDGTRYYIDALDEQSQAEQKIHDEGLTAWRKYIAEQDQLLNSLVNTTTGSLAALRSAIDAEISGLGDANALKLDAINNDFDARIDSANSWLDTQLKSYQRRGDALAESIADLTSLSGVLESAMQSLRVESYEVEQQRFSAARSGIADLLKSVNAGGGLPQADLVSSLTNDLSGGEQFFTSFREYDLAMSHTLSDLAQLDSVAGAKLTDSERLLAQLESSEQNAAKFNARLLSENEIDRAFAVAVQQEQHDAEVALLEDQYTQFEQSVNELHGIGENTLSIDAAINTLQESMAAERAQRAVVETQQFEEMRDALTEISENTAAALRAEASDHYATYGEEAAA